MGPAGTPGDSFDPDNNMHVRTIKVSSGSYPRTRVLLGETIVNEEKNTSGVWG